MLTYICFHRWTLMDSKQGWGTIWMMWIWIETFLTRCESPFPLASFLSSPLISSFKNCSLWTPSTTRSWGNLKYKQLWPGVERRGLQPLQVCMRSTSDPMNDLFFILIFFLTSSGYSPFYLQGALVANYPWDGGMSRKYSADNLLRLF